MCKPIDALSKPYIGVFWKIFAIASLLVTGHCSWAGGSWAGEIPEESPPLPQAHSHNDYHHSRPLLDALNRGFTSVEADVFLVDGELLVGHSQDELSPERTLKHLYLAPLFERFEKHGSIYEENDLPLTLLIDIKSDGAKTFALLQALLAEYSEMLSTVEGDEWKLKAVSVIVSGNRPEKEIAAASPRYASVDGRLSDLDSDKPASLMPLISDNWSRHFKWRGRGSMPESERKRLREVVQQAHDQGRRIRFWATPEEPLLWAELLEAGVDLIGTDDLERLSEFLRARSE